MINCDTYPKKVIVERTILGVGIRINIIKTIQSLLKRIMRKAYQFRIYPTNKQEVKLNNTLSTCRHLYNDAMAERNTVGTTEIEACLSGLSTDTMMQEAPAR